jgi:eukaryotic-like serine/threonine-protein kinase
LLDFGLVKAIDTRRQTILTAADSITGTPLYLPPETIQNPDSADSRSDLYSLGAVGYFLLTGHPVFEGGNVLEIIRQHVESQPVPPSQRAARPMAADLEQLLLKCLAKSPAERPQTAAQLADALAQCVPLEPWTAADAVRWWTQYQPVPKTDGEAAATLAIDLSATIGYSQVGRKM